VGNVKTVELSGESGRRTVVVAMDVRREYLSRIPADSMAAINPEGVFGDKYVNITRGKSPTSVVEGGEIASLDTREVQEIVNESYNVLASLQGITGRIDKMMAQVEQGKGTVGKLLYDESLYNRMDNVVAQAQNLVGEVANGKGTIGKLLSDDQLYYQANTTLSRIDGLVNDAQSGKGTIGRLLQDPSLYNSANSALEKVHKTIANVNAGQGTVGKLLKDDELYRLGGDTISKANETIDRMNSGQGTIGQLLVNRSLYDTMTAMTAETRQFIKDVRANPKKFLRIKLGIF